MKKLIKQKIEKLLSKEEEIVNVERIQIFYSVFFI